MKYYVVTAKNPLTNARDVVSVPMTNKTARQMMRKLRKQQPGVYELFKLNEYDPNQLTLQL